MDGVIYQIYPRSFADSNGDGIGDLRGITRRLDHLAWLGVDAIWLNPITVSPNKDWGYDVADYCDVDPALGTLDDLDELVAEARRAGHPHPARPRAEPLERPAPVVPSTPARPGTPRTATGTSGPTATPDGPGRPQQLAELVRRAGLELRRRRPASGTCTTSCRSSRTSTGGTRTWARSSTGILRFWFDRGIAGFRIDVCHMIVKDKELRDNPPVDFWIDHEAERFNAERPELHDVLRRWRRMAEEYDPPRLLLGETYVAGPARWPASTARATSSSWPSTSRSSAPFHAEPLRRSSTRRRPPCRPARGRCGRGPTTTTAASRPGGPQNDPAGSASAAHAAVTLRGTPVLYYGDEIGLEHQDIPKEQGARLRRPT